MPVKKNDVTPDGVRLDERRAKVFQLHYVMNRTQGEIAIELKTSRKTVERDVEFLKHTTPAHLTHDFAQEMVRKSTAKLDHAMRTAMHNMEKAVSPRDKLVAAKAVYDMIATEIKLFQDLGVVDRASVKIEVNESERFKSAFLHFLAIKGLNKEFSALYKGYLSDPDAKLPEVKK